jgi:hypothetical protein
MSNTLCSLISEAELQKTLPITKRKINKLRLTGQIPFVRIDRRTRLYDVEKVVAALERLEIKPK